MDYAIFSKLETAPWAQEENESGQQYMERVLTAVCSGSSTDKAKDINDYLNPTLYTCDAAQKQLCLKYQTQDWMRNPFNYLHGGISATMLDITMGLLTRYFQKASQLVTIQMSVNYLSGVPVGNYALVRANIQRQGNRITFLSASVFAEGSDQPAVTATASFMKIC